MTSTNSKLSLWTASALFAAGLAFGLTPATATAGSKTMDEQKQQTEGLSDTQLESTDQTQAVIADEAKLSDEKKATATETKGQSGGS